MGFLIVHTTFRRAQFQAGWRVMGEGSLPAVETAWITERAAALGFDLCGIAQAEEFPELQNYSAWIDAGYAGEMKYLKDPRRLDPRESLPGVQSIVVCALNYNSRLPYSTEVNSASDGKVAGWISRYAWGDDYHEALWERLNLLIAEMRAHFPEPFEARGYADTGPIHERAAAKHAGLGWLGKNTLLINQAKGSWLFLGAVLTSLPLTPTLGPLGAPPPDRCGSCTRCLDACPTQAIVEPYVLDATRCISYLTIEMRGAIREDLREPMGRHVFGCDICQDVCPWNRKSPRTELREFQPRRVGADQADSNTLFQPDLLNLARMSDAEFHEGFRGSPIKRTKRRGLLRNACVALGNSRLEPKSASYGEIIDVLQQLGKTEDEVVAESARWALSRILSGSGRARE
jgi:epoxyqueuosine reductase